MRCVRIQWGNFNVSLIDLHHLHEAIIEHVRVVQIHEDNLPFFLGQYWHWHVDGKSNRFLLM